MKPEYLGIISSLAGVTVGGLISYLIQLSRQRHAYELKIEELKTEHMAERTGVLRHCKKFWGVLKMMNSEKYSFVPGRYEAIATMKSGGRCWKECLKKSKRNRKSVHKDFDQGTFYFIDMRGLPGPH